MWQLVKCGKLFRGSEWGPNDREPEHRQTRQIHTKRRKGKLSMKKKRLLSVHAIVIVKDRLSSEMGV